MDQKGQYAYCNGKAAGVPDCKIRRTKMDDLTELANIRMPYGKYKDRYLMDLPEPYLVWLARQGFPAGKLGRMLESMLEIKTNGLEKLLLPLRLNQP